MLNSVGFLITDALSKCHDVGMLHWHTFMLNVWLTVDGDKGQGSFKMGFKVVNVQKPNRQSNTVIFKCFEAVDSYLNLVIGLGNLDSLLRSIDGSKWMGKLLKVFFFGDYEFL